MEYILIGGGFAFAAAAQPGPLQAFLLSRVAAVGWRRTLPAAFAPVISDGPIAVLMLTLLHHVARGFESFLRGAGGLVLMYFAVRTFLEWRRAKEGIVLESTSSPRTLLQAVAVNLVNPGPYIGWSLILGPVALEAWSDAPVKAVVLVVTFYVVMVVSLRSKRTGAHSPPPGGGLVSPRRGGSTLPDEAPTGATFYPELEESTRFSSPLGRI